MKVNGIEETAHSPYFGPWSAWTSWQTICTRGLVVWQTRTRTRQVGETWSRRTRNQDCTDIGLPPPFNVWLQSVTYGEWETVTQTTTATEREYRTLYLAAGIAKWREFIMAALPTLHLGDRLRMDWAFLAGIPQVKAYSAMFDGNPIEGDYFDLDVDMADGHHTIDLDVETDDGRHRYQVAYAAAARLAAWFAEPTVEIKLPRKGGPNGATVSLMVANRSSETILVRPVLESIPAGWKAVFLDEQPTKLARGRESEFVLQLEAMTDAAVRTGPLPVSVAVLAVGKEPGREERACASCVIRLTGDARTIAEIERKSIERMRRHQPLVDTRP
jgi:hypothetical protein